MVGRLLEESAQRSGKFDFGLRLADQRTVANLGALALLVSEQPTIRKAIDVLVGCMFLHSESLLLNMKEHDVELTSIVPALGVRAAHLFKAESKHPFLIGGNLGLEFEVGETSREVSAQFVDAPGTGFLVQGTEQSHYAGEIGFHARVALTETLQTYANAGFSLAPDHTTQTYLGGLRWKW